MATYHVSVMQLHPDGPKDCNGNPTIDMDKKCSKYVFGPKQCLTVGEANALKKQKEEEYFTMVINVTEENPEGERVPNPEAKKQYSVTREHY
jgi:hypothetical protein